ncbi:hypothetical protein AAVH_11708 [Aphelenchoides avenae]|nr:hypothetical protein AAVH_11708 [Aphelenchus avenae]
MRKLSLSTVLALLSATTFLAVVRGEGSTTPTAGRPEEVFCKAFSKCRASALAQFEECSGSFAQLILTRHNALGLFETHPAGKNDTCLQKLAEADIKPLYAHIDKAITNCTQKNRNEPRLIQSEVTVCQVLEQEILGAESTIIKGVRSEGECRQIYEADIRRCELIKDCCPSYSGCQSRMESDIGIAAKESHLVGQFKKCLEDPEFVLSVPEPIVRQPASGATGGVLLTGTTIPPTTTTTTVPVTTTASASPTTTWLTPSPEAIKKHQEKVALRKKLREERERAEKEKLEAEKSTTSTTAQPEPKPEKPTKKRDKKPTPAAEVPGVAFSTDYSQEKKMVNHLFCMHYVECREVLEEQYRRCDEKYLSASDDYGIGDRTTRLLFLSNSNVSDEAVQSKCIAAVDPDSQRHASPKEKLTTQNGRCMEASMSGSLEGIDVHQCEKIRLLHELSEISMHQEVLPKGRESAEKCYQALRPLEDKCAALSGCCPQHKRCEESNHSNEANMYSQIVAQLKAEQSLCEKRHMRIRNGLVK